MPEERGAVPSEPALKGPAVHSLNVLADSVTRYTRQATKHLAEGLDHLA
jgi:hypothetical protein